MVTVESGSGQSGSGQRGSGPSDPFAGFGPNEWLVYEMYQQYLKDPESGDKAWWEFFADYKPADAAPNGAPTSGAAARSPPTDQVSPPEPAPAPAPSPPKPAAKASKPATEPSRRG